MMNRNLWRKALLASLLFLCFGMAKADDFLRNGIYYSTLSKEAIGRTAKVIAHPKGTPYSGENLIIPSTVTYEGVPYEVIGIDPYAFANSTYRSVTIPKSVTNVSHHAFQNCTNLESVTYSNGVVTAVQYNTFEGCTSLKTVNLPGTIQLIGDYAFKGCTSLSEIRSPIGNSYTTFPASLESIGGFAFQDCISLTSVTIPSKVVYMGYNPFIGCNNIESLRVNSDNEVFDSRGVCNAIINTSTNKLVSGCKTTSIPSTVTCIGEYAFYSISNMSSVTITSGIKSISMAAFQNCTQLKHVRCNAATPPLCDGDVFGSQISSMELYVSNVSKYKSTSPWSGFGNILPLSEYKESYTITYMVDGNVYATEEVTEGSTITPKAAPAKSGYIFNEWIGLPETMPGNDVTVEASYTYRPFIFKYNGLYYRTVAHGEVEVIGCLYADEEYTGGITIPETVHYEGVDYAVSSIEDRAFNGSSNLTSVVIPNSVTSIGYSAFAHCSNLAEITLPESISRIEAYLFYGCANLTSIIIPDSVESIGNHAFYDCSALANVIIPRYVTSIGSYAFDGCSSFTNIEIPNSVTSIGQYAFEGCSGLTSITLPDAITYISFGLFNGCSNLSHIEIPKSVTSIHISAFSGCSSLDNVTLPESVSRIESFTFFMCSNLTNIEIPNSVTSIGEHAFEGCSGLTSITIPNSVTSIDGAAFAYCSNLTSITIPNSVTNIGYSAFYACN